MSGKRGRRRGSRLADLESLGIKPGDGVPPPILQPPGLYPPLERRPLDLSNTEADQYMLAVKQDHAVVAKQLPFYITRDTRHHDIHRYSNKYRSPQTPSLESLLTHIPQWKTVLPKQLHFDKKPKKRNPAKNTSKNARDKKLLEKLSMLADEEGEGSGESEGEDGNATEDDYYDEELEEETGNYQLTAYFDPGDGDDDEFEGDALDGPSY